jgi:hypothetical protein
MALGAVSFWLPDTLWHALRPFKFDSWDLIGITVLMPLSLLGTYAAVVKRLHRASQRGPVVWPMLLGVWLLGGFFMMVGASFSGGGFVSPSGRFGILEVLLMSLLPVYVFMMATYDGSLMALLVVSIALPIWAVCVSRRSSSPR